MKWREDIKRFACLTQLNNRIELIIIYCGLKYSGRWIEFRIENMKQEMAEWWLAEKLALEKYWGNDWCDCNGSLNEFEFEIHSNDIWNDSFLNREVGFSLGSCLESYAKLFDVDAISLRPVDYIVPINSYSFIFGTSASERFCDNTVFTSSTFVFFIEENISCIVEGKQSKWQWIFLYINTTRGSADCDKLEVDWFSVDSPEELLTWSQYMSRQ